MSMAFAIALGTTACHSDPVTVPLLRLADVRADRLGQHEPPAVSIGETTRYVLAGPRIVTGAWLDDSALAAVRRGTLSYTFRCPPREVGRRLVLALRGYAGTPTPADRVPQPVLEVVLKGRCPRDEDGVATVTFRDVARIAIGSARVDMALLPAREVVTDWIDLPEGARLDTHVGLAGERGAAMTRGAFFRIRATNAAGAVETVAEQRTGPISWSPLSADLNGVRGRLGPRVALTFEARPIGRTSLVPVWGDPTIVVKRSGARRRRNVVLISLDTLRADHLGAYGYPGPVSPHLDQLANEGALFANAVTLSNWTLPSHATMLTGVDPCIHGFRGRRSGPVPKGLPPGVEPLAEILRRRGWITAAFTENGYVVPGVFQRGFDEFHASKRPHEGRIEDTFQAASDWLRRHARDEFFLLLHTYQVHEPYDPPEPHRARFAQNGRRLPHAEKAAAYAGEVAFTDAVVGEFLGLLGEVGVRDRTIVIVTSDHGESFGEHRWGGHGMSLHEEEVRVPLIFLAPGLIREGVRVESLASLGDLVPTVVDMLGLPPPAVVNGVNLYDTMRAEAVVPAATAPTDRVLVIEGLTGRSVRTPTWKTIFGGRILGGTDVSFFDLRQDPEERAPRRLPRHDPTEAALTEHEAMCARLRAEVGVADEGTMLDRDVQDRLRALGYVP